VKRRVGRSLQKERVIREGEGNLKKQAAGGRRKGQGERGRDGGRGAKRIWLESVPKMGGKGN